MKHYIYLGLILILTFTIITGCASKNDVKNSKNNTSNGYEQITPDEAKALMDNEDDFIILDVRTEEEYATEHITNAILIPDYEIAEKAESILTDKDQLILVYCRSGSRSKNAASTLAMLGYTNIKEFGGIIDWKYDTITE